MCGKTEAAHRFGSEFGWTVVKPWADLTCARPSLTSVSRTLLSVARGAVSTFVLDRFITSEYVYGPLLGRETSYLNDLLEEWRPVGSEMILVLCSVPEGELVVRYAKGQEKCFTLDEVRDIRRRYLGLPGLLPPWLELLPCSAFEECAGALARRCAVGPR